MNWFRHKHADFHQLQVRKEVVRTVQDELYADKSGMLSLPRWDRRGVREELSAAIVDECDLRLGRMDTIAPVERDILRSMVVDLFHWKRPTTRIHAPSRSLFGKRDTLKAFNSLAVRGYLEVAAEDREFPLLKRYRLTDKLWNELGVFPRLEGWHYSAWRVEGKPLTSWVSGKQSLLHADTLLIDSAKNEDRWHYGTLRNSENVDVGAVRTHLILSSQYIRPFRIGNELHLEYSHPIDQRAIFKVSDQSTCGLAGHSARLPQGDDCAGVWTFDRRTALRWESLANNSAPHSAVQFRHPMLYAIDSVFPIDDRRLLFATASPQTGVTQSAQRFLLVIREGDELRIEHEFGAELLFSKNKYSPSRTHIAGARFIGSDLYIAFSVSTLNYLDKACLVRVQGDTVKASRSFTELMYRNDTPDAFALTPNSLLVGRYAERKAVLEHVRLTDGENWQSQLIEVPHRIGDLAISPSGRSFAVLESRRGGKISLWRADDNLQFSPVSSFVHDCEADAQEGVWTDDSNFYFTEEVGSDHDLRPGGTALIHVELGASGKADELDWYADQGEAHERYEFLPRGSLTDREGLADSVKLAHTALKLFFGVDGHLYCSTRNGQLLRFMNGDLSTEPESLLNLQSAIKSVDCHPDGKRLLVLLRNGTLSEINLETDEREDESQNHENIATLPRTVNSVGLNQKPEPSLIFAGYCADLRSIVKVYNDGLLQLVRRSHHKNTVLPVAQSWIRPDPTLDNAALSPCRRVLIAASKTSKDHERSLLTGVEISHEISDQPFRKVWRLRRGFQPKSIIFSPNGDRLFLDNRMTPVTSSNFYKPEQFELLPMYSGFTAAVGISPSQNAIFLAGHFSQGAGFRIFSLTERDGHGRCLLLAQSVHHNGRKITAGLMSPDGTRVYLAYEGGHLKTYS